MRKNDFMKRITAVSMALAVFLSGSKLQGIQVVAAEEPHSQTRYAVGDGTPIQVGVETELESGTTYTFTAAEEGTYYFNGNNFYIYESCDDLAYYGSVLTLREGGYCKIRYENHSGSVDPGWINIQSEADLPALEQGVSETFDRECSCYYTFTPNQDGEYNMDGSGFSWSLFDVDSGFTSNAGLTSMKAGQKYTIQVNVYDSYRAKGTMTRYTKQTLTEGEWFDPSEIEGLVYYEFTPTETGKYCVEGTTNYLMGTGGSWNHIYNMEANVPVQIVPETKDPVRLLKLSDLEAIQVDQIQTLSPERRLKLYKFCPTVDGICNLSLSGRISYGLCLFDEADERFYQEMLCYEAGTTYYVAMEVTAESDYTFSLDAYTDGGIIALGESKETEKDMTYYTFTPTVNDTYYTENSYFYDKETGKELGTIASLEANKEYYLMVRNSYENVVIRQVGQPEQMQLNVPVTVPANDTVLYQFTPQKDAMYCLDLPNTVSARYFQSGETWWRGEASGSISLSKGVTYYFRLQSSSDTEKRVTLLECVEEEAKKNQ